MKKVLVLAAAAAGVAALRRRRRGTAEQDAAVWHAAVAPQSPTPATERG